MHHITGLVSGFPDPANGQDDWLTWIMVNQHHVSFFDDAEANYVLLTRAGNKYNWPVRIRYGERLRSMLPRDVVIALGKVIYRRQGNDPLLHMALPKFDKWNLFVCQSGSDFL